METGERETVFAETERYECVVSNRRLLRTKAENTNQKRRNDGVKYSFASDCLGNRSRVNRNEWLMKTISCWLQIMRESTL